MKLTEYIGIALMALAPAAAASAAQLPAGNKADSFIGIEVSDISLDDNVVTVDLALDLSKVDMKSNFETLYTPMFVQGTDTLRLQPFAVAGRNRMYWERRNDALEPLTFYKGRLVDDQRIAPKGNGYSLTAVGAPEAKTYGLQLSTPYQEWMETACFTIDAEARGCANCLKGEEDFALAQNDFVTITYFPEFVYVTPVAEAVKMREISARAYIDFVVNRTEINPTYRRNPEELAKIRATIDSVQNDKDITIKTLHISGTASPEGSYQNNVRLAKGRTESLKNYVQGLYQFPKDFITTSYEPVDWTGLAQFLQLIIGVNDDTYANDSIRQDQFRAIEQFLTTPGTNYVEQVPHAREILAIVDGDLEPYARNSKIRSTYPKEYAWLLANVYPALRHSDYRIQFEIKTFTEVSEILEVMQESPQKLSLAELFVAANSQEPGSELYNRAFELAVTMFPSDETANLNAATAAMVRGDLVTADRFLSKVKTSSPGADYEKAMLKLMQGDQEAALEMFRVLQNSSDAEVSAKAKAAVEGITEMNETNARKFIRLSPNEI